MKAPGIGTTAFAHLPPCVDDKGHRFTIPPTQSKSVCTRCGHIREAKL